MTLRAKADHHRPLLDTPPKKIMKQKENIKQKVQHLEGW
jgi:hypothetical protein